MKCSDELCGVCEGKDHAAEFVAISSRSLGVQPLMMKYVVAKTGGLSSAMHQASYLVPLFLSGRDILVGDATR